jgi:hypothetical protein
MGQTTGTQKKWHYCQIGSHHWTLDLQPDPQLFPSELSYSTAMPEIQSTKFKQDTKHGNQKNLQICRYMCQ